MKPGDEVWVFTGQNIEHFVVDSMDGNVVCGFLDSGISIRLLLPYPVFPTSEALCEHYRKIFE
jgi:hypothetical protein